jgi:hypothetical protein
MGVLQVPAGPQSSSRAGGGFERLYSALGDFGDHQLVLAGLQENFPAARYLDSHMARTAAVADALADGDRLLRAVHRRSDFAALKFAPAHALAVRAIVAGPQRCALHEALAAQGKLQAQWKLHLQIMEYKRYPRGERSTESQPWQHRAKCKHSQAQVWCLLISRGMPA